MPGSELPVGRGGRLVHGVLCGFLGVANRLLALTLDFLNGAFALQAVGAYGFADALLGLAHRFVRVAFNLVCDATHEMSPCSIGLMKNQFLGRRNVPCGLACRRYFL